MLRESSKVGQQHSGVSGLFTGLAIELADSVCGVAVIFHLQEGKTCKWEIYAVSPRLITAVNRDASIRDT